MSDSLWFAYNKRPGCWRTNTVKSASTEIHTSISRINVISPIINVYYPADQSICFRSFKASIKYIKMLNDFHEFHVDRLGMLKIDLVLFMLNFFIIYNSVFSFDDINWSSFLKKPIRCSKIETKVSSETIKPHLPCVFKTLVHILCIYF